jgi:hypothetical protein
MNMEEMERMRIEKEHKMRYGYQDHSNKKFPHHEENSNGGSDINAHGVELQ